MIGANGWMPEACHACLFIRDCVLPIIYHVLCSHICLETCLTYYVLRLTDELERGRPLISRQ